MFSFKTGKPAKQSASKAVSQGVISNGVYLLPKGGNVLLAFGLGWYPLNGLGSIETQAKNLANNKKAQFVSIFQSKKAGVEVVLGCLDRSVRVPKKMSVEAGAACFAAAINEPTGLYLGPGPSDNTYVLVGILLGSPSPEFDVVGDVHEVMRAADQYRSYLTDGAALYLHTAVKTAFHEQLLDEELGEFIQSNITVIREVDEMPYSSTGPMLKPGSSALIVQVGLGIVIVGVLAGGWVVYQDWETKNNQVAKEMALREAALTAYKASLETAYKSEGIQKALPAARLLWEQVGRLPVAKKGWLLASVTCSGGSCVSDFTRVPETTFRAFKDAQRSDETPSMEITKLDSASTSAEIPGWKDVPVVTLESLDTQSPIDLTVPLGTQAQIMQLAGLGVSLTVPGPMGDASAVNAKNIVVKKYLAGGWTITGPMDTFVPATSRLPATATLSMLKVSFADKAVVFSASGRYLLQK